VELPGRQKKQLKVRRGGRAARMARKST